MMNGYYKNNSGMINKPADWDSIETLSDDRPTEGAYIFKIIDSTVEPAKNFEQGNILKLELDIAEGEFKEHYTHLSSKLNKNCLLKYYQLCEKKSSLPFFKKLINDIEQSNIGYTFDFNCSTLRGKYVGGYAFYEKYQSKNGQWKDILKIDKFATVNDIRIVLSYSTAIPNKHQHRPPPPPPPPPVKEQNNKKTVDKFASPYNDDLPF
jgi:hypothetical protein